MPELPEVETARRGIAPHVLGQQISALVVRQRSLRWPVPASLARNIEGGTVRSIERRGKYLLLAIDAGTLILHLGMSGSLRILPGSLAASAHDHVDICFGNGNCLRLRDPRRFGAVLFTRNDPARHRLLRYLGPEPLTSAFDGEHLYRLSRGRRTPVKSFVMNGRIVAGVGNIYANEALYLAGIHPARAAGRISLERYDRLAGAIKTTLAQAIRKGGTTLRDFTREDGSPGYFRIELKVYERDGCACSSCGSIIRTVVQGQRATYYCPCCQR